MDLKKWADKQTTYIILGDGEFVDAVFLKAEVIPNRFDADKEMIRYHLQLEDGDIKHFESGATGVARQFDKVEEGEKVKIKRDGEGTQTKYAIGIIKEEKKK